MTSKSNGGSGTSKAVTPGTRAAKMSLLERSYGNWGMRTKIVTIVATLTVVMTAVVAVALYGANHAVNNSDTIESVQNDVAFPIGLVHQEELKSRMLIAMTAAQTAPGFSDIAKWTEKMAGTDADLDAAAAAYEAGIAGLGSATERLGKDDWQAFKTAWAEWKTVRDTTMLTAAKSGSAEDFADAVDVAQPSLDEAIARLEAEETLVAEVSRELAATADADATTTFVTAVATFVVGVVLAVVFALAAASMLRKQVFSVKRVADALAKGDFTVASGVSTKDEIGRMGVALDEAAAALRETMAAVTNSAREVAAASRHLAEGNAKVADGAQEVSARAETVASAASEISRNLGDVSRGSEEMTASIREIAHSTAEAARVAQQAADAAKAADTQIGRLGVSSQEIGDVVKAITQIAGQTNLLALNATIEAARAGEAGKGFAVVAGEVGELARETARATEDIARRVEAIQTDAQGAVTAIAQIAGIVQSINEFQSTIASAIEEQTATTNEMGRNVVDAAQGSEEIAVGIDSVASSAATSSQVLNDVSESVAELDRLASTLREQVAAFTY